MRYPQAVADENFSREDAKGRYDFTENADIRRSCGKTLEICGRCVIGIIRMSNLKENT